jgi:hypothetical protein
MSKPHFCIYTSLFTLQTRPPENNPYVWIYLTWLWSLLTSADLIPGFDRIVVHIDPETHAFLTKSPMHNELCKHHEGNSLVSYYFHEAPNTLLAGFLARHDCEFINHLISTQRDAEHTIYLHIDIDTIFQAPLRSLAWPEYEQGQIYITNEGKSILGDCYAGAFLAHCIEADERTYYEENLRPYMESGPGFTAGLFGFTFGPHIYSLFNDITSHVNGTRDCIYAEQGCFNYMVSKYHITGTLTMNPVPFSLPGVIGVNKNSSEPIISLMGEAGNGACHLEKVIGYLASELSITRYNYNVAKRNLDYAVVVARYNESLDWLSIFDPARVHVYNKGNPLDCPYTVKSLPNIGREAHTYLQYIIDNYEHLPSVVFFTQGTVHDHGVKTSADYIFNNYINILNHSHPLHDPITKHLTDGRIKAWKGDLVPARGDIHEFARTYVQKPIPDPACIFWCAIFSVSRERIRSRPLEYYKKLISIPELLYTNCEVAHYFERLWYYIFNCDN